MSWKHNFPQGATGLAKRVVNFVDIEMYCLVEIYSQKSLFNIWVHLKPEVILNSEYCDLYCRESLKVFIVCYIKNHDVNNQQDATTFSFIDLFNSAPHVSGDIFAHPQEHFLTVYTAFGTKHWHCSRPLPRLSPFHLNRGSGRQQCRCIVPKAVYTVRNCSWGWAN